MKIGHYAIENQPLEVKTGQYPNLEAVATRPPSVPLMSLRRQDPTHCPPRRRSYGMVAAGGVASPKPWPNAKLPTAIALGGGRS